MPGRAMKTGVSIFGARELRLPSLSFIGKNPINSMVIFSWRNKIGHCVKLPNLHTTDNNPLL